MQKTKYSILLLIVLFQLIWLSSKLTEQWREVVRRLGDFLSPHVLAHANRLFRDRKSLCRGINITRFDRAMSKAVLPPDIFATIPTARTV